MKRLLPVLSLLILAACGPKAQVADITPKYLSTITTDELRQHLTIVASDEMEGRNTGSAGQKKTADYLISQYTASGINAPATGWRQAVPSSFLTKHGRSPLNDSENIMAYIEGSQFPDEVIVISAHYDHVGVIDGQIHNGADDDGSGTVALLEIAEALHEAKKDGKGPKRSVLFLHVTGEEHGLLGSKYYSENPVFPIANTVANVNIDMIGRRDFEHPDTNNYIYLIGADRLSTELHEICKEVNKKYLNIDLDYRFNERNDPNRFYFRSDHYNFAKHGIPSVFLFSGVHEDYHQPGDDVDKIEFDALERRAKLAFLIVWELANRDKRIAVDRDGK
jgi:Zn-dependent M28 family amino/carboxypeptidase